MLPTIAASNKMGLPRAYVSAGIYLVVTFLFHQLNPGFGTTNFVFGFPRVLAEFFAGVLIYQLGFHRKPARPKLTLMVALAVAFWLIFFGGGYSALLNSLTLIPLIVVLASAIKIESPSLRRACKVLGNLSYPLYIVHFPMLRLLWQIPLVRTLTPISQTVVVGGLCILLALLLAVIDEHLRKTLNGRTVGVRLGTI